jgi:hypothetical protein
MGSLQDGEVIGCGAHMSIPAAAFFPGGNPKPACFV